MPRKISFLTTCPGCGDTHVEVNCKKPTFIVPVKTYSVCDKCESKILFDVSLPRKAEKRGQVITKAVHIRPSSQLVQMLQMRELEAIASAEQAKDEVVPSSTEI